MPSYRLDTQPWIPVVLKTGTPAEVSLLDAIERAPGIRTIAGNPLEVAVLARLLVAIAHAVRQPQDPSTSGTTGGPCWMIWRPM